MGTNPNRRCCGRSRLALVCLIASLLVTQSGCGVVELNEKALVSMIGLDYTNSGNVRVTMGLINTRKMDKAERAVEIYSTEGQTIFDAIRGLIMVVGNQPLWPYIKIVVIGPTISKKDVTPILDFFNRNNEIQPNPYVVLSEVPAEEIVNLKTDMSNLPAAIVEQQIDNQSLLGFSPQVAFYQFTEMMFSGAKIGYASLIKKESKAEHSVPKVEGMVVLKKGAWIGALNDKETRGVLWVRKQVKGGILVPDLKETGLDSNTKIGLEILRMTKGSIKVNLANDQLSAVFDIGCTLSIGEVLGSLPLTQPATEDIRQRAQAMIKKEVEDSLRKTQKEWKTDIYGINTVVHRKYPAYWRKIRGNWDEIFSQMPIEVRVSAEIKKMGLSK